MAQEEKREDQQGHWHARCQRKECLDGIFSTNDPTVVDSVHQKAIMMTSWWHGEEKLADQKSQWNTL